MRIAPVIKTVAGALLALALLPITACATVVLDARSTEPQARPSKPPGYPIALLDDPVPARPHKVIGSVRARVKLSESTDRIAPPPHVVEALKDQARRLGGDALLPITTTPVTGGGTYLSPTGSVLAGNSVISNALVIVWLDQ